MLNFYEPVNNDPYIKTHLKQYANAQKYVEQSSI